MKRRTAFTLVEVIIVITILAILAMVALPQFAVSRDDAREAALNTDFKTIRRQIDLYIQEHGGRGPEVNQSNALDTANFSARLTGRTQPTGALDPAGPCGPYLTEWPENPFCTNGKGAVVSFSTSDLPPRTGATGWFFSTSSKKLYVNTDRGAGDIE